VVLPDKPSTKKRVNGCGGKIRDVGFAHICGSNIQCDKNCVATTALFLHPLILNRPFVARLVKHRSNDSFLEGIAGGRVAGFGRMATVVNERLGGKNS
jgi:hypothetical protein